MARCIVCGKNAIKSLVVDSECIDNLQVEMAQLRAERDKAVEDIKTVSHKHGDCDYCKYRDEKGRCTEPNPGKLCKEKNKWQWRGLKCEE